MLLNLESLTATLMGVPPPPPVPNVALCPPNGRPAVATIFALDVRLTAATFNSTLHLWALPGPNGPTKLTDLAKRFDELLASTKAAYDAATTPADKARFQSMPEYQALTLEERGAALFNAARRIGLPAEGTALDTNALSSRWLVGSCLPLPVWAQAASGDIRFSSVPDVASTLDLNGVTWTFGAAAAPGQTRIRATIGETLTALLDDLALSGDPALAQCEFMRNVAGDVLTVRFRTPGAAGNAVVLNASATSHGTPPPAKKLAGGLDWHCDLQYIVAAKATAAEVAATKNTSARALSQFDPLHTSVPVTGAALVAHSAAEQARCRTLVAAPWTPAKFRALGEEWGTLARWNPFAALFPVLEILRGAGSFRCTRFVAGAPAAGGTVLDIAVPSRVRFAAGASPELSIATVEPRARGVIDFSALPAPTSTITLGTTVWRFVAGTPTALQTQLDTTLDKTMDRLVRNLSGSADPQVAMCSYRWVSSTKSLELMAREPGVAGNAFAYGADAASHGVAAAATLQGGAAMNAVSFTIASRTTAGVDTRIGTLDFAAAEAHGVATMLAAEIPAGDRLVVIAPAAVDTTMTKLRLSLTANVVDGAAYLDAFASGFYGVFGAADLDMFCSTSAGLSIARALWRATASGRVDAPARALGIPHVANVDAALAGDTQPIGKGGLEPPIEDGLFVAMLPPQKEKTPIPQLAYGRLVALKASKFDKYNGISYAGSMPVQAIMLPNGEPPFNLEVKFTGQRGLSGSAARDQWGRVLAAIALTEGLVDAVVSRDLAVCSLGFQQWSFHAPENGPALLSRLKRLHGGVFDAVVRTSGLGAGPPGTAVTDVAGSGISPQLWPDPGRAGSKHELWSHCLLVVQGRGGERAISDLAGKKVAIVESSPQAALIQRLAAGLAPAVKWKVKSSEKEALDELAKPPATRADAAVVGDVAVVAPNRILFRAQGWVGLSAVPAASVALGVGWYKSGTDFIAGKRIVDFDARWVVATWFVPEIWQAQAELAMMRFQYVSDVLNRQPALSGEDARGSAGPARFTDLMGSEACAAVLLDTQINSPDAFNKCVRLAPRKAVEAERFADHKISLDEGTWLRMLPTLLNKRWPFPEHPSGWVTATRVQKLLDEVLDLEKEALPAVSSSVRFLW